MNKILILSLIYPQEYKKEAWPQKSNLSDGEVRNAFYTYKEPPLTTLIYWIISENKNL